MLERQLSIFKFQVSGTASPRGFSIESRTRATGTPQVNCHNNDSSSEDCIFKLNLASSFRMNELF